MPKVVTIQEQPKGKAAAPSQEWKANVGKLPAAPPKTSKPAPAPAPNKTAASKNVKGGSDMLAAARKPLVSRN